jgi:hypothetical protein
MAIPSRQIGGSTNANLLWQISKQLERLICVRAGGCTTTTTTTTTVLSTNYNVAGCERMEYHVITYTGEGELLDGTIVSNATPECWFIIDQTTDPADVGTIDTVYGEGSRCETCIDSHTTTTTTTAVPTTTTTTTIVLVRINLASFGLGTPCTPHIPPTLIVAYTSAACLAAITVGCIMYADDIGTLLSQGYYEYVGGYFYVNNLGEIVNIGVCPQP